MKIVVALANPPRPEGEAPARCALAQLRGLAANGLDVRAVAARQHYSSAEPPPTDLAVDVIDVAPEPPSWSGRLRRLQRPRGELAGGEFASRVRAAARDADVLHLDETQTAWCDEGLATPSLVAIHYLVRRDRSLAWPWCREFRQLLEFRLAERAAVRRHAFVVANSPQVADELRRQAPGKDVAVVPLSLDPTYYARATLDGAPVAGLLGTASWPTTRAAVDRLLAQVWPRVRSVVPDATLRIAGRGMADVARTAPSKGIEVLGEVPSAAEFLRDLSVLLFPLERGSGMKVKVLESLVCGLPVVTTPSGAEGIAAGSGVVVATDDTALAAAAIDVLRDEAERIERGAAARRTFDQHYAPERATEPLIELYSRMIGG